MCGGTRGDRATSQHPPGFESVAMRSDSHAGWVMTYCLHPAIQLKRGHVQPNEVATVAHDRFWALLRCVRRSARAS